MPALLKEVWPLCISLIEGGVAFMCQPYCKRRGLYVSALLKEVWPSCTSLFEGGVASASVLVKEALYTPLDAIFSGTSTVKSLN